jgi:hypothetical protein
VIITPCQLGFCSALVQSYNNEIQIWINLSQPEAQGWQRWNALFHAQGGIMQTNAILIMGQMTDPIFPAYRPTSVTV